MTGIFCFRLRICMMIFTVWTMIHFSQVWRQSQRRTSLTGIEKSFDTFLCRFGPWGHGFVLKTMLGWEPRGAKLEHYAADKMRAILPKIGWLLPVLCQSA